MSPEDVIALNDQIAGMARAGLPLDQGLEGLARDMGRGKLRAVTQAIADDLKAGHPLPEALDRQKGRVPPYYASLVTAGVRTGKLPEVLATLTAYARAISTTRRIVVDALFYPAVVLSLGVALVVMLALFVLPQFDTIFRDFGMKLPVVTEWVMVVGRNPIETVVVPIVGAVLGFVVAWFLFRRTRRGRYFWARAIYLVPLIGTLIRAARLAAFTELLAMLVEYELPLPEAFRLAGEASSDPVMGEKALLVADRLARGAPLGEAFRGRGLVPEWVAWMAGAGEQRGGLAESLRQIAVVYRRQVDSRAAVLRSVLPPFVVLFTAGVLVFVFAVAVMVPMVRLMEGLSK